MEKDGPARGKDRRARTTPDSFDRWLDEGLHKLYDDVMKAPLPENLLALIESHRETPADAPVVTPEDDGHPGA